MFQSNFAMMENIIRKFNLDVDLSEFTSKMNQIQMMGFFPNLS